MSEEETLVQVVTQVFKSLGDVQRIMKELEVANAKQT